MTSNPDAVMALETAGCELADRLRELRDEFGPEDADVTMDQGWLSVEASLDKWKRARRGLKTPAASDAL